MGNTLSASNALFATYVPVKVATLQSVMDARRAEHASPEMLMTLSITCVTSCGSYYSVASPMALAACEAARTRSRDRANGPTRRRLRASRQLQHRPKVNRCAHLGAGDDHRRPVPRREASLTAIVTGSLNATRGRQWHLEQRPAAAPTGGKRCDEIVRATRCHFKSAACEHNADGD
jgi:hypothetical protein